MMTRVFLTAGLVVLSAALVVCGCGYGTLVALVAAVLVYRLYPETRTEVDPTNKAVFITGTFI